MRRVILELVSIADQQANIRITIIESRGPFGKVPVPSRKSGTTNDKVCYLTTTTGGQ